MSVPRTKTYFVADIHLGAPYVGDRRRHEALFVDFLKHIAADAARIYLLGDIFDYHFEYRNAIPAQNLRTLGTLGRLADRGIEIVWIGGNHDSWFAGTLARELNITTTRANIVETVIDGTRFLLTHGDAVGPVSRSYRTLRAILRNPVARCLYAAVHPRWTTGLALFCSSRSRRNQGGILPEPWRGDDVEPISIFARDLVAADPAGAPDYIIAGHRHLPKDIALANGRSRLVILGCGYETISYADFDGTALRLLTYPG